MPIRLTCPSCSATLSVKDEHAGRAVKCPKCGDIIPAAQPATASPPSPAPAPVPYDDFDEPPKPAKTGGKITGKPVARSEDADELPEDEETTRRKGRDADDRDRAAKRRRRDEDDDRSPGRGQKPPGKSNTGMILIIVGGLLLLCCGGVGGVGWLVAEKVKEQAQKDRDRGTATTPIEITALALAKEERANSDATTTKYSQKWLIIEGTLQGYEFGMGQFILLDDGVRCSAEGDEFKRFFGVSKGQRIRLKGKYFGGTVLSEGTLEWTGPDPSIQVTAEVLLNDYKDRASGDAKYKNKEVTVTKALVDEIPQGEVVLISTEKIPSRKKILADNIGFRQSHFPDLKEGKSVTVKGTCKGEAKGDILIGNARFVP